MMTRRDITAALAATPVVSLASPQAWGRKALETPHDRMASRPSLQAANPVAEMVVDVTAGRVVHAYQVDVAVQPASLTKLMTLHMFWTALEGGLVREDTPMRVSARAAASPPSKLGLLEGDSIMAGQATMAMAVHSCNDIAVVVAEMLADSEERFALLMTQQATVMGLHGTRFGNASGLPHAGNVSTARDLIIMGMTTVLKHPAHAGALGQTSWVYGERLYFNTNHLMGLYPGMVAGKTGYIRESGFNLFTMASRNGKTLAGVVVGGKTAVARDTRMQALLDAGFST